MSKVRIGVIGAGVVGLTTALQLQDEFPSALIYIIAEKFNTETTSDGAAGFFCPSLSFEAPNPKLTKDILRDSYAYYEDLRVNCKEDIGIYQTSGYCLSNDDIEEVENELINDIVPEYRPATEEELQVGNTRYKYGAYFVSLMIEGRRFLPWALNRFQMRNGKVIQRRIENFGELSEYKFDVIVNCSGLGGKTLCRDRHVVPLRGQVLRVSAPWVKHFYFTDDETYIIPGKFDVTLGGCRHYGSSDLNVDPHLSMKILDNCSKILPGLKDSPVIREWVGLRPYRVPLRVESQILDIDGVQFKIVHNYGHGAQGVTTAPGSAKYAVHLVRQILTTSKL